MSPKRSAKEWVPDPGDPILHVPSGKTLILTRVLKMNNHTYYVCRKPEPHVGPAHAMLPASMCERPKPKRTPPKSWAKDAQEPLPDPESTEES
jgi:hypothetical protein